VAERAAYRVACGFHSPTAMCISTAPGSTEVETQLVLHSGVAQVGRQVPNVERHDMPAQLEVAASDPMTIPVES
jgi:hypothetical protein